MSIRSRGRIRTHSTGPPQFLGARRRDFSERESLEPLGTAVLQNLEVLPVQPRHEGTLTVEHPGGELNVSSFRAKEQVVSVPCPGRLACADASRRDAQRAKTSMASRAATIARMGDILKGPIGSYSSDLAAPGVTQHRARERGLAGPGFNRSEEYSDAQAGRFVGLADALLVNVATVTGVARRGRGIIRATVAAAGVPALTVPRSRRAIVTVDAVRRAIVVSLPSSAWAIANPVPAAVEPWTIFGAVPVTLSCVAC